MSKDTLIFVAVVVVGVVLLTIFMALSAQGSGDWCWQGGHRACAITWDPCPAWLADRTETSDGVTTYLRSSKHCTCAEGTP